MDEGQAQTQMASGDPPPIAVYKRKRFTNITKLTDEEDLRLEKLWGPWLATYGEDKARELVFNEITKILSRRNLTPDSSTGPSTAVPLRLSSLKLSKILAPVVPHPSGEIPRLWLIGYEPSTRENILELLRNGGAKYVIKMKGLVDDTIHVVSEKRLGILAHIIFHSWEDVRKARTFLDGFKMPGIEPLCAINPSDPDSPVQYADALRQLILRSSTQTPRLLTQPNSHPRPPPPDSTQGTSVPTSNQVTRTNVTVHAHDPSSIRPETSNPGPLPTTVRLEPPLPVSHPPATAAPGPSESGIHQAHLVSSVNPVHESLPNRQALDSQETAFQGAVAQRAAGKDMHGSRKRRKRRHRHRHRGTNNGGHNQRDQWQGGQRYYDGYENEDGYYEDDGYWDEEEEYWEEEDGYWEYEHEYEYGYEHEYGYEDFGPQPPHNYHSRDRHASSSSHPGQHSRPKRKRRNNRAKSRRHNHQETPLQNEPIVHSSPIQVSQPALTPLTATGEVYHTAPPPPPSPSLAAPVSHPVVAQRPVPRDQHYNVPIPSAQSTSRSNNATSGNNRDDLHMDMHVHVKQEHQMGHVRPTATSRDLDSSRIHIKQEPGLGADPGPIPVEARRAKHDVIHVKQEPRDR